MGEQILSKLCRKCGETKLNTQFGKARRNKNGLQSACKACCSVAGAAYKAANAAKCLATSAAYRANNKDKIKLANATWAKANRDAVAATATAWRKANPAKVAASRAASYAANPEKARSRSAAYRAANPEKAKAADRASKSKNQERVKATAAAYYAANQEKIKSAGIAYRAANSERIKAATAAWHAANPDARRIHEQNRRARKRAAGGTLSKDLSSQLFKLQKGKCVCCGQKLGDDYHLDHKMPLALGGENIDSNMQLLRATCNQQKYAKHPVDFMQERGFLL